ncbi:hypothetical protein HZC20_02795 [Candidatus Peregrinibacteria bacterium]|nr:hypothetical protein [Candidatus Peregrinibacteria bacterium]
MGEAGGYGAHSLRRLAGFLAAGRRRRKPNGGGFRPEAEAGDSRDGNLTTSTETLHPNFSLVSVCSDRVNDIMVRAAEGRSIVLIFKTNSRKLIRGIPCLSPSSSGFSITPYGARGGFCRDVAVEAGDYIVEGVGSLDVDTDALVSAVMAKVLSAAKPNGEGSATADVPDSQKGCSDKKTLRKYSKREMGMGGFLCALALIGDKDVDERMDALLKIDRAYLEDAGGILEKKDAVFAEFFSRFIGLKRRERLSRFNKLVCEGATAKGIPTSDITVATSLFISYLNVILRQCVPTASTKAAGLTKGDSGIPVKIDLDKCEAVFDVKVLETDGDEGGRDAVDGNNLRNLHGNTIAGLVDRIRGDENQMLLDALVFAYFGVSFNDLEILFNAKNIPERIEDLNRRLEKYGFVVYANNGIAMIAEARRPVRVMGAHAMDGCYYDGRFKNQLGADFEDSTSRCRRHGELMDEYKKYRYENVSKMKAAAAEKGHKGKMRSRIESYLKAMDSVGSCAVDISERVASIISPARRRKHKDGYGWRASTHDTVFDILNMRAPNALARDLHDEVKGLAEGFKTSNKNSVYVNGRLLLNAMIYQFHGVSIDEANKLPFSFQSGGDETLSDVIAKTNSVLAEHGISICESNGFLVLAKDENVFAKRDDVRKHVFLVANPIKRPLKSPLERMIPKK